MYLNNLKILLKKPFIRRAFFLVHFFLFFLRCENTIIGAIKELCNINLLFAFANPL